MATMATKASTLSREAEKDYRDKVKLERRLARKMTMYFLWSANFAQNQFIQGNKKPKVSPFIFDDILKTLGIHYNRVAKKFTKKVVMDGVKLTSAEKKELLSDIETQGKKHVNLTTPLIVSTLQDDIDRAVTEALEKKDISRAKQAKLVKAKVKRSSLGRAKSTIPITETQEPAEQSKYMTAIALDDSINKKHVRTAMKTWVTVGDEKVRPAHQVADLQQQDLTIPFVVGGEELERPKDQSLGASLENVINCRCSAQYGFKQQ